MSQSTPPPPPNQGGMVREKSVFVREKLLKSRQKSRCEFKSKKKSIKKVDASLSRKKSRSEKSMRVKVEKKSKKKKSKVDPNNRRTTILQMLHHDGTFFFGPPKKKFIFGTAFKIQCFLSAPV